MKASELYYKFQKIRLNVDKILTPNLSQIKEIIKRVHFANIGNEQMALDNKGNAYYKLSENSEAETFYNLTLSYTIEAKKTGVVYGLIEEKEDKDGQKIPIFNGKGKINQFNNYARFLVDITSGKVIYSKTLKRFVIVLKNAYKPIDETSFNLEYPVDKANQISDFLNVIEQIFETIINVETHDYNIFPYSFGGTDWVYNCQKLQLKDKVHGEKDLYFQFFEVAKSDLNFEIVENYLKLIADSEHSFNNVSLMHAYTLLRKIKLVPPERFFIMKDYGRTGKGLLMLTFDDVFKINKVNFDNLITGGFE
ncbi:MAG: phage resistance protein, partial [Streptococcaceae bacterium]|nr:phage resistance protein [Streptococcaceae bacterium]